MLINEFWMNKRVFITGHTGFKGSWLTLWLNEMGAEVTGYSLNPPTTPSLFDLCQLQEVTHTYINDIRNYDALAKSIEFADPDIIIHMAAQPLVRDSYINPIDTYAINVMGTLNLFESVRAFALRSSNKKRVIINVTTDKCYENREWHWGYRENEPMGGYDPYSNSKACSELVTSSYRSSFFNPQHIQEHGVLLASARAGNVIGGGDWAKDRLIPDCIRSLLNSEPITVRNPYSIRPWQHVLEPLSGYLLLAQTLFEKGTGFAEGWNFGPNDEDAKPVEWIANKICALWGEDASYNIVNEQDAVHEAQYLKLDCSKAKNDLKWQPRWTLEKTLENIIEWVRVYQNQGSLKDICIKQIHEYVS